ncbi:sugar kinase [Dermatophilus congolensis]|uniref:5-dehydro-2-deoxygluconokinase n=2 Tax=Dermatophilus congolensis TaxID=1863 RepID=A0AA46BMI3_9MICO|nr:sugar kinase [Dermatophilus congolensis]MBO3142585.1 sugar kinase [Dermatophilus congolensis]MBO3151573.1 sugar kinase [Dermatophilus congolensis]MBO3161424.1 sugar kinase [Dermatophilus congolensis]MBO3162858.1 sugar kinase [Dermatophilus congolensis]MBO3176412.1 sugar kinase [Dermatophilus congolensis]
MSTYELTTFGEAQIRLTVHRGERLATCSDLRLTPAGSEANVAGLLAQLARRTTYATVLPGGDLACRFLSEYRGAGVDLSHVVRVPEGRMALYFLEPGDPPMPARVTYDRHHTAFRDITPNTFNWDALLDTDVLFVTGITAALTPSTAATVTYAVTQAHRRGVRVALDVNYRSLLWTPAQARAVLEPLFDKVDILFCSRSDAHKLFGLDGDGPAINAQLHAMYNTINHVISTDGINGVYYSGIEGKSIHAVETVPITDRPGAGDSFVAATLHGYLGNSVKDGIIWGLRTSKLALTHHGDLTHVTPEELAIPTTADILR